MDNNDEYKDGWVGFTRADLKEMYNTNSAQWPEWVWCKSGGNFDAKASLKANGLHPDRIPEALRDNYGSGALIKEIAKHIDLTYIPTPEK